jgi:hypothetical protein
VGVPRRECLDFTFLPSRAAQGAAQRAERRAAAYFAVSQSFAVTARFHLFQIVKEADRTGSQR